MLQDIRGGVVLNRDRKLRNGVSISHQVIKAKKKVIADATSVTANIPTNWEPVTDAVFDAMSVCRTRI